MSATVPQHRHTLDESKSRKEQYQPCDMFKTYSVQWLSLADVLHIQDCRSPSEARQVFKDMPLINVKWVKLRNRMNKVIDSKVAEKQE